MAMTVWEWAHLIGILGPILLMLGFGFALTVRSGVAHLATWSGLKRAFENATEVVILVVGCLIGLAVIHHLVGQRVGVIW